MDGAQRPVAEVEALAGAATGLLGRDYWLMLSRPLPTTSAADIAATVGAHLDWLLRLEAAGSVLMSGPLLDGPDTGPGSGLTVLRAQDADEARRIAAGDPFVVAGLRTFDVYRWRVNEGSISVSVSLGTGRYVWH